MEENNQGPIVDNETGSLKVKEKTEKQPDNTTTEGNITKVVEKMKMEPLDLDQETITKVDLNKVEEEVKQEEVVTEVETTDTPVLEEVTEEAKEEAIEVAEATSDALKESMEVGTPLPENIQKVVDFMEETGGDLNDYVKLNQDFSKLDNDDLLLEYYKQTKPHLNNEEINFLMEDRFSFDEEADDENEVKRKKLALKEQVANAKTHLEETKSKYYEEIKAGSKLTPEQQKAVNFYDSYSKESEERGRYEESAKSTFVSRTNKFFGDKFKGFEYNVGEKNYRFNVNDVDKVKETQSDINNFIGKFLDENRHMKDEAGYHKALYSAMNPDIVAKHFYEQGKADALKNSIEKSKNINMDPRQTMKDNVDNSGVKVKVLGDNTSDFKFKIKNNK